MENKEIRKLALDLKFDLSDAEVEEIQAEFEELEKKIKLLDEINTEGVEEMVYPFEIETTYLREDEVTNVLSQEDALKNVSKVKQGHVVVPKVVK